MLQGFSGALVMAVTRPWVTPSRTVFTRIGNYFSYYLASWRMRFLPRRKLLDIQQTLARTRKILVITPGRPWQTLHALKTIAALKETFDQAEVFAVIDPAARQVVESGGLVDEIVGELPAGAHPLSPQFGRLSRTIQSCNFDLVINLGLEPNLTSLYLVYRSQAVIRVGFHPGRLPSPYNIVVIPSNDVVYEADRYLRLLLPLGVKVEEKRLTWAMTKKERDDAGRALRRLGVRRAEPLIAIDCTSSQDEEHLTLERIQALSNHLVEELKARPLIFIDAGAGVREEPEASGPEQIPLSDAARYLVHCRAMITTNTNLFHIGQALDVPSVLVFKSNDVRRWIPERFEKLERIPVEDLNDIPVERVVRATERLISEPA